MPSHAIQRSFALATLLLGWQGVAQAEQLLLDDVQFQLATDRFVRAEVTTGTPPNIPLDTVSSIGGSITLDLRLENGNVTGMRLQDAAITASDASGRAVTGIPGNYVDFSYRNVVASAMQLTPDLIEFSVPNQYDGDVFEYFFSAGEIEYEGFGPLGSLLGSNVADLTGVPAGNRRTDAPGFFTVTPTGVPGELSITLDILLEYTEPIGQGFSLITYWDMSAMAVVTVPEPGTWALLTLGAFAIVPLVRRARR